MKKPVVLIAVLGLAFAFGGYHYFTLETLKSGQSQFIALYDQHPWQVMVAFFEVYITVAVLSLPGATILTLTAGAMFGLLGGMERYSKRSVDMVTGHAREKGLNLLTRLG